MLNIFKTKKITIPKDNAQTITELESWTIKWSTQGNTYGSEIVNFKTFIKESEAKEFEKQLLESAKFIKIWIHTKLYKND